MKSLEIHVVSYKRPTVLAYTIDSLLQYMTPPQFFDEINLRIAFNEVSIDDKIVGGNLQRAENYGLYTNLDNLSIIYYEENMGKAYALNDMFKQFAKPHSTIITLDGDMVFTDVYMDIIETTAAHLRFDLVGFASKQFWGHYPLKEETMYRDWRGYKVWHTISIAGGIMMGTYEFLSKYEWTNVDGIYGGDDFNMSLLTDLKFIVEDERDWLVHDPLGPTLPELSQYYAAKDYYRKQGLFIYPHGWYENARL